MTVLKRNEQMSTKVHLSEPVNFIGVTYGSVGEQLLRGAESPQRQLKAHQSVGDTHRGWKPREHCTSCVQFNRLESGCQTSWLISASPR